MSNIRVRPINVEEEGSFRERARILRTLATIRNKDTDFIEGQLLLDELIISRAETTDGSDLEDALDKLSAVEADNLVQQLLVSEVPTESAEN